MTVAGFMEQLAKLPPDAEIVVKGEAPRVTMVLGKAGVAGHFEIKEGCEWPWAGMTEWFVPSVLARSGEWDKGKRRLVLEDVAFHFCIAAEAHDGVVGWAVAVPEALKEWGVLSWPLMRSAEGPLSGSETAKAALESWAGPL